MPVEVIGGKRLQPMPGGVGIDLTPSQSPDYAVVIPTGLRSFLQKDGVYIIDGGVSNSNIVLPVPGAGATSILIRNRAGRAITIEGLNALVEDAPSYVMTTNVCWLRAVNASHWYVVVGA